MNYFLIVVAGVFSALGNILIKYASQKIFPENLSFFLFGVISYFCNLLLFTFSLKTIKVSIGYPLLACSSILFSLLLASIIFKETLNIYQIIGISLAVISITLISSGN